MAKAAKAAKTEKTAKTENPLEEFTPKASRADHSDMFAPGSNVVRLRLTITQDMLATTPGDTDLLKTWIQGKSKEPLTTEMKDEEIAAMADAEGKQMTVFPRDKNGNPMMWAYQFKGFLKEAAKSVKREEGTLTSKVVNHIQLIDNNIFPRGVDYPGEIRKIRLHLPEGGSIGRLVRPLRVTGPGGTRVCLSASETVPAGTVLTLDIRVPVLASEGKGRWNDLRACFKEWLNYGADKGLLQWRAAGWGTFTYEVVNPN